MCPLSKYFLALLCVACVVLAWAQFEDTQKKKDLYVWLRAVMESMSGSVQAQLGCVFFSWWSVVRNPAETLMELIGCPFSLQTCAVSLIVECVFCVFQVRWWEGGESEAMGCTSAKQVSAVPNDEEGHGKAYSNGDLFTGQLQTHTHITSSGKCTLM